MLTKSCCGVGPEHFFCLVVGVAVETCGGVQCAMVGGDELVDSIIIDFFNGITCDGSRQAAKREAHEDTVEPHLMGVDGFVPVGAVGCSWLLVELLHQRLHGLEVLLFRLLYVESGQEVACADVVQIVILQLIASDGPFAVNHRIGV